MALEAPVFEPTSDIIEAEPELRSPRDVEVLQQFKQTLEGGLTLHDAAIDKHDEPPLLLDNDSDAELDTKLYKSIDALSPEHLATHL